MKKKPKITVQDKVKPEKVVKMPMKTVEMYMPLVHSIASMVAGKGLPPSIDYNDLVSDGTVGLLKAWEGFDPGRGVKFETYASYRIRGEILDGLKNYNPVPYRVQVVIRDVAKRGYRALLEGKDKKGKKEELDEELSKKKLSEGEFKSAVKKIKKVVAASALMYLLSLEGIREKRGEVKISTEKTPADELDFAELKGRLTNAVEGLPELEKKVLDLFFNKDMSQKDISDQMKLSRSKVNRVIGRTVNTLREKLGR
ncbi:sigma-70 family RNA polymerase sigma factor [Candidatus Margulisiibacteriota bacterium]